MRCHFSSTRLVKMKMPHHMVCLWECSETNTLLYSWWDVVQPFCKVIWQHLWKGKLCTPYDPGGVPLPGLQHRQTVPHMLQKICTWVLLQHCWKYKIWTLLDILWCIHTTVFFKNKCCNLTLWIFIFKWLAIMVISSHTPFLGYNIYHFKTRPYPRTVGLAMDYTYHMPYLFICSSYDCV